MPIYMYDIFYSQTVMEAYSIGVIGKTLLSFVLSQKLLDLSEMYPILKTVHVRFLLLFPNRC